MRLKLLAVLLLCAPGAFAQTESYWRTALHDLYRYDVAFDACKEVTPSAAEMLRLEAAIAHVEEKTGLQEDELDELYGVVEGEAANMAEFCKQWADAVARVQALPPDYR